jgi:flavodoxin I
MKKIGLFYWPIGGNVEKVAQEIEKYFDDIEVTDLSKVTSDDLYNYEYLIFGGSTFGADYWEQASTDNKWYLMFHDLEEKEVDLKSKKVAFYGLGDQVRYPHHFVDGLRIIHDNFAKHNIKVVGHWPNEGYEFYESQALTDNKFLGLVLDMDNSKEKMPEKVEKWVADLKEEFK